MSSIIGFEGIEQYYVHVFVLFINKIIFKIILMIVKVDVVILWCTPLMF